MALEIRLPVRDRSEVITTRTIVELPQLLDDPDERAIAREILIFASQDVGRGSPVTVGQVEEVFESFDLEERKGMLDVVRRRAGLARVKELEAARAQQEAQKAPRLMGTWAYSPSGAIIDLGECDAESQSQRARAESLANRRESERRDAEVEAARIRDAEEARAEAFRSATPQGFAAP